MPIYEYECPRCHDQTEHILSIREMEKKVLWCHECKVMLDKIITASGQYCSNDDAPWLKSVLDVVDKENPHPATQEFIKNPTRSNYKAWMKSEGIRPMDAGERSTAKEFDEQRHADKVMEKHFKRKAISI